MRLFDIVVKSKKCGKLSATLFGFFLLVNNHIIANDLPDTCLPKDSLKNRYALNDPRNPKCPCHLHQKKAEREYKRKLKLDLKVQKTKYSRWSFIASNKKNTISIKKYLFKNFHSLKPRRKKIKDKKIHTRHWINKANNCPHF